MRRLIHGFLALMITCVPLHARSIPISGTIQMLNGDLFNGKIRFILSHAPARDISTNNRVVPQRLEFPILNGMTPASARITPNDVLMPKNTFYVAQYVSSAGAVIAQHVFYIRGNRFDIGTATPTPLTTNNSSFGHFQGLDRDAKKIDNVRMCDQYAGSNAGSKIAACIADLPATGGVADATGLEGAQVISSDIFAGVTKPGELHLGSTTFLVSTPIKVPSNWIVRGVGPSTELVASSTTLPAIPEEGSPSAIVYVVAKSSGVTIRDLYVKGAYSGTGPSGSTFGIYVGSSSSNVSIVDNKVTNNSWSGILLKGAGHLVHGNYTEHNAIDGIESFATNTRIVGNHSVDEAAASSNGVGCIELLPGSSNVKIITNHCEGSNHQGIVLSSGSSMISSVVIDSNTVANPGWRGIADNAGTTDLTITNNLVHEPRGPGSLGNGIMLSNTTRFAVANNIVVNANRGMGPSGIEITGTSAGGVVLDNVTHHNWVGLAITGHAGESESILIAGNHSYSNLGGDYANTSSGSLVLANTNTFGTPSSTRDHN